MFAPASWASTLLLAAAATTAAAAASDPVNAKDVASIFLFSEKCATCEVPVAPSCANYTMKDYCTHIVVGNNMDNCQFPGSGANCWFEKCSGSDLPATHMSIWGYGCSYIGEKRHQLVECEKHGAGKAEMGPLGASGSSLNCIAFKSCFDHR
ncbi:hypothetical protein B0T22DRAFT_461654 [Podospora appendiculata]|uniref:Uncharacterized protein n=1 Tax=Podospora appendiculata TaxID=314037 RepID=A0AAE0WYG8_9PEZI|nr:hypothetical protein B0T22DRAFT_474715 [Podospora appendiculata]KAK3689507.1 hypothetical protein B0T22DRAFT_461654 [Podospora appendiculata]